MIYRQRRNDLARWLLLLIIFAIPYVAFVNLILNHFFRLGGFWGDSGVLSYLLWHNGPKLLMPQIAGGQSFLAVHTALIFIPLTLLSWVLTLTKVQFFAAVVGLSNALPAVAVYCTLVFHHQLRNWSGLIFATALSLLFAFNGISIAAAKNPHFELLIIGTGMLFFVSILRQQLRWSCLWFVLCLTVREDSGFDLFALLAVTITINLWNDGRLREQKTLGLFAIIALIYSISAMIAQQMIFPGVGALTTVYLGHPAFADIRSEDILDRVAFIVIYRPYIWLPAILTMLAGIALKNVYLAAGWLAFLPWFILNLLASSTIASTLSNYYSFPFIFALFWPLVCDRLYAPAQFQVIKRPLRISVFAIVLVSTFAGLKFQHNPGHLSIPSSFLWPPTGRQQYATNTAILDIHDSRNKFGHLLVDSSVAALDPNEYTRADLVSSPQSIRPDSILFFVHGYRSQLVQSVAAQAELDRLYAIPGTDLEVLTDRELNLGSSPLLVAEPLAHRR